MQSTGPARASRRDFFSRRKIERGSFPISDCGTAAPASNSTKTLRRHYRRELDRGAACVQAKLIGHLHRLASGSVAWRSGRSNLRSDVGLGGATRRGSVSHLSLEARDKEQFLNDGPYLREQRLNVALMSEIPPAVCRLVSYILELWKSCSSISPQIPASLVERRRDQITQEKEVQCPIRISESSFEYRGQATEAAETEVQAAARYP